MIEKRKSEVYTNLGDDFVFDRFVFEDDSVIDTFSKKIYNVHDDVDMCILCDDLNRITIDKTSERFMVDDCGTLIDKYTRDTYDYVSEVVGVLNQLNQENERLKE